MLRLRPGPQMMQNGSDQLHSSYSYGTEGPAQPQCTFSGYLLNHDERPPSNHYPPSVSCSVSEGSEAFQAFHFAADNTQYRLEPIVATRRPANERSVCNPFQKTKQTSWFPTATARPVIQLGLRCNDPGMALKSSGFKSLNRNEYDKFSRSNKNVIHSASWLPKERIVQNESYTNSEGSLQNDFNFKNLDQVFSQFIESTKRPADMSSGDAIIANIMPLLTEDEILSGMSPLLASTSRQDSGKEQLVPEDGGDSIPDWSDISQSQIPEGDVLKYIVGVDCFQAAEGAYRLAERQRQTIENKKPYVPNISAQLKVNKPRGRPKKEQSAAEEKRVDGRRKTVVSYVQSLSNKESVPETPSSCDLGISQGRKRRGTGQTSEDFHDQSPKIEHLDESELKRKKNNAASQSSRKKKKDQVEQSEIQRQQLEFRNAQLKRRSTALEHVFSSITEFLKFPDFKSFN